ncbi:protein IQ-DOMAIN 33 isoform X2 [Daucus carota subsp. sativus]|uniref:protein IQ-DOMAIN 33 isoform X2 n=1 Tax=Daucus carota subsp. sativus TaxID=79200 RepID=UPI0007EF98EC|nr:PREDICTED: protein IQ-DOMAIN 1 isoform X2 [Daucus carota subsp. sativus]
MGITGELVRSVFSKSKSIRGHEANVRSNQERKRWKSSVRSYLCGDEFNSVLAEEDSASLRSSKVTVSTEPEFSSTNVDDPASSVWSSEATVTQPVPENLVEKTDAESKQNDVDIQEEKHNSTSNLFRKDDAAIVIQSALRRFLARRHKEGLSLMDCKEKLVVGAESKRSNSVGTSIEVQTGNLTVQSFQEESESQLQRVQHKGRPQVLKLKEDWDDSTVSSNISKLRMQNRLEATTRRERALAYAFSQQLRVCSKKKHTRSESEVVESNMGWNWLERWMATRQQDNCLTEITKQYEPLNRNQKTATRKRLLFDIGGEEESCGSNEVAIQLDNFSVPAFSKEKEDYTKPLQDRLKPTSVSRCKTLPRDHYSKETVKLDAQTSNPKDNVKVIKKQSAGEDEIDKKHNKPKQPSGLKKEAECKDATSKASPEL